MGEFSPPPFFFLSPLLPEPPSHRNQALVLLHIITKFHPPPPISKITKIHPPFQNPGSAPGLAQRDTFKTMFRLTFAFRETLLSPVQYLP